MLENREQERETLDKETCVSYRNIYFRINAEGYLPGWSDEAAKGRFKDECRALFSAAGWEIHIGSDGCSDIVTKDNQDLYLHPQSFSGVILESEVQPIKELLAKAKSFKCYHVDFYEEYLDINDDEYLEVLESKREEITAALLKRCKTKRSNLYIVSPFAMEIAEQFSVKRVCDKENRHNKAYRFVSDIVDQLIEQGLLVTAKTRHGDGVRTATAKERKALDQIPERSDTFEA